jgi:hypothetical protein
MLQPREEEAIHSEEICINEYHAINMVELQDAFRKCKKRKLSELDGTNMELIKYVSEKVGGNRLVQLWNDMWNIVVLPE